MEGKTNISAQIPVSLHAAVIPILKRDSLNMSEYIRLCLRKLVEEDEGSVFIPDNYHQLIAFLESELKAGGIAADALRARLAEIAAMPERAEAA